MQPFTQEVFQLAVQQEMKYVKQSQWIEIGKVLLVRYPICQYCFKEGSTQLAHALFYKRYLPGTKNAKVRDVKENAMPCGDNCQKFSETYKGRQHAWKMLCTREGSNHMREWHDNFPAKIKETFE